MFPDFSAKRQEALSGIEIPSVLGGVSPGHLDELSQTHFIVIPTAPVKHYNRDGLGNLLGRYVTVEMVDGEIWTSPYSYVLRIRCDRPTFARMLSEFKKMCSDFGATQIFHYLSTEPETL